MIYYHFLIYNFDFAIALWNVLWNKWGWYICSSTGTKAPYHQVFLMEMALNNRSSINLKKMYYMRLMSRLNYLYLKYCAVQLCDDWLAGGILIALSSVFNSELRKSFRWGRVRLDFLLCPPSNKTPARHAFRVTLERVEFLTIIYSVTNFILYMALLR
jgi:hypothetical protein